VRWGVTFAVGLLLASGCGGSPARRPPNQARVIDEMASSYRGISLGDSEARVEANLGHATRGQSLFPLKSSASWLELGGPNLIPTPTSCRPSSQSRRAALRYTEVVALVCDQSVYALLIFDQRAETSRGVGIGDPLREVSDSYGGVQCRDTARGDAGVPFKYCAGSLEQGRYIWFGGDPIASVVLSTTLPR
jgi:hypothetical protein